MANKPAYEHSFEQTQGWQKASSFKNICETKVPKENFILFVSWTSDSDSSVVLTDGFMVFVLAEIRPKSDEQKNIKAASTHRPMQILIAKTGDLFIRVNCSDNKANGWSAITQF